jgi:ankyrin repeat protein
VPISYRAAQTLIKRGDEPALRAALATGLDPNLVNQNGWSLLMLAAVEGDLPLGRLLLEFNADAALQNNKGETALTLAQHRGYDLFAAILTSVS